MTGVTDALDGVPLDGTPTISVSRSCLNASGQTVTVDVTAATNLDIPLWGSEAITLHGKGKFRCERCSRSWRGGPATRVGRSR